MISSSADKKNKNKKRTSENGAFFAPDFACKIRNGDRGK